MSHAAFRSDRGLTRDVLLHTAIRFSGLSWLALCCFLASCGSKQASGPHATVLMRDGSTLTGTVTATSPAEITLAGDDNTAHAVPMAQVKTIEYDDHSADTNCAHARRVHTSTAGLSGPGGVRFLSRASLPSDAVGNSYQDVRARGWHSGFRAKRRDDRLSYGGRRSDVCC